MRVYLVCRLLTEGPRRHFAIHPGHTTATQRQHGLMAQATLATGRIVSGDTYCFIIAGRDST